MGIENGLPSNIGTKEENNSLENKKRIVYSSDSDYFEHLPVHLQYLLKTPLLFRSQSTLHFPAYEVEIGNTVSDPNMKDIVDGALEAIRKVESRYGIVPPSSE